jgi:hypothetical protein
MLIVRWRSGAVDRRENPRLSEVARELSGCAIGDVADKASEQVIKAIEPAARLRAAWAFIGTSRSREPLP